MTIKKLITLMGVTVFIAACSEQGPMEETGEKVDEAVTDTQNAIEDSCENIKEDLKAEDTDC
ncbi:MULTISPECIES: hypothetical protein [unclassified Vibrio]|uniref:Lipoprotein n=1 Tax=Vibrio sp. HB236076 TaxID=3232307 RepID=A0AB39HJN9_9VIBR|nr:hypothetical protein [Vibrio sp. HB161653]MDP5255121.1 hypothetical protein [Vibrio sp. HB161653]